MKNYTIRTLYALCLGVFLTIGCKDSGTGNNDDLKGLEQDFLTENQIGNWKTKVKDVVQTDDGVVIIGAYREESGGCGDSVYITKINNEGEEVWLKKFDELTVSSCNAIHLQKTATNGFIAFATTPYGTSSFETDYFIMKFTTVGDLMWTKQSGDNDVYWRINGLETNTGKLVTYSTSTSNIYSDIDTRSRLTFDQNGGLLSEEINTDYEGTLASIIKTPSRNYIFNIRDKNGTDLMVKDAALNTLTSSRIDNQYIGYINVVEGSEDGYIAQTSTSILKLDSEFNIEWKHTISGDINERGELGSIAGRNLVEIGNGFYAFIEVEPHVFKDNLLVAYGSHYLTILNSSGEVTNTQEVGGGGEFYLAATNNQNIMVISSDSGLKVQAFRTTDLIN